MTNKKDYAPIPYACNGATVDFPFGWKVLNEESVVVTLVDKQAETETVLDLGVHYTVDFDEVGGNVKTKTAYPSTNDIIISRKASLYQEKTFSTSSGFQASEVEKAFDNVSINLQDMDYNIENFKASFSNKVETEIETNKADTDKQIEDNKTDTDNQISTFESEVNQKIAQVNEAVQKLNRLDDVLKECEQYSGHAEEQSAIAQQQANLSKGYSEDADQNLKQIKVEHEEITSEISTLRTQTLDDVLALKNQTMNDVNSTKVLAENEIKRLGIYMQDNRLFYRDSNNVVHEFRNDYGGIAPMRVKHKEIIKVENGFALTWTDPDDSIYQNNVYCTWGKTVIVRKIGSYPESVYDGEQILVSDVHNKYAETPYIDEVNTNIDFKYRAFPCSINEVYSMDNGNKFGVWIYAFEENDLENNPAKRITYLEDNKYFKENYMNFSSDEFNYADWKDSPFYHWDYIRPCMLYNSSAVDSEGNNLCGQVMEYLDPNDHSKTIDGKPSHYADTTCNANAMVEKRKIFLKVEKVDENKTRYYFSNEKLSEEYECYPCLRADGTYNEFYYTPMFHGALVNNKLVSLGGGLPAMSGRTAQQEIDFARANGDGHDTEVWSDIDYEELIFRLVFKNTDAQSCLGNGVTNSSNALSGSGVSGRAYNKGANYGTTGSDFPVKFRYRENFYAYQWHRFRGLIYINNIPHVKMTRHTGDGSAVTDYNTTGVGYIPLTEVPAVTGSSGGYISKTCSTKYGTFSTVVSGSSSTNLCDGRWFATGTMYPFRGGSSNYGLLCGAFTLVSDNAPSNTHWSFGSALSYKPL